MISLPRRPGVPPKTALPQPLVDAMPHLEALARLELADDEIIAEIARLRRGETRFVNAVLAAQQEEAADDLSFLDAIEADRPHSSTLPRRPGVRK